ncbi:hypothetical protein [Deinococcus pimensis]|uniref:hypothetical protein n=1 Tax=Deinococcus pimensis TaxID=309888 RepID=UPI000488F810|nr:hypothetical protein [Deinococcus pimensis]
MKHDVFLARLARLTREIKAEAEQLYLRGVGLEDADERTVLKALESALTCVSAANRRLQDAGTDEST